jgi:hypothetical protein
MALCAGHQLHFISGRYKGGLAEGRGQREQQGKGRGQREKGKGERAEGDRERGEGRGRKEGELHAQLQARRCLRLSPAATEKRFGFCGARSPNTAAHVEGRRRGRGRVLRHRVITVFRFHIDIARPGRDHDQTTEPTAKSCCELIDDCRNLLPDFACPY